MSNLEKLKQKMMVKPIIKEKEEIAVVIKGNNGLAFKSPRSFKALILVYTMGRGPGTIGTQLLSEGMCPYKRSFLRMYLGNPILR